MPFEPRATAATFGLVFPPSLFAWCFRRPLFAWRFR
jgi:hypothetical protein